VTDAFDVVREFHRALNRGDVAALAEAYHLDCVLEHVFVDDARVMIGRGAARERWTAELAQFAGALPGGHRVDVQQIGGIETGWGWVRSAWLSAVQPVGGPSVRCFTGHSHFWVEDGLIRRHRAVMREIPSLDAAAPRTTAASTSEEPSRRYPKRPIVGVGAVIVSEDLRVVLVKRRYEPLAGQWSLPGGTLELGETLEAGTEREVVEETGLVVDVGPVVEVFDRILLDDRAAVQYHFVLVDYLCRPRQGTLGAGSDVDEAVFADPGALDSYRLTDKARGVIVRALEIAGGR
jgi:8-oxo-dGTP diphosphatase